MRFLVIYIKKFLTSDEKYITFSFLLPCFLGMGFECSVQTLGAVVKKKILSTVVFIFAVHIFCFPLQFFGALATDENPLSDISSILIRPYTHEHTEAVPELPNHVKKYRGDQFGYGAVFVYNTAVQWGDVSTPLSHKNILARLYDYKTKEFSSGKNDKNILFVKVKFYNEDPEKNFECFFGLHVSGEYQQTKRPLKDIAIDLYTPKPSIIDNTALKHFLPLKLVNRLLAEHPEIRDYCLPLPLVIEKKDMDESAHLCKLFKVDSIDRPFVLLSNSAYKKVDNLNVDLRSKIERRLKLGNGDNDALALGIFGCKTDSLFASDKVIGDNFNQSEQSFLSALEFGQDYWSWGHHTIGQTYTASIDLYSYLDICVVCRGTFSRMLQNEELIKALTGFVSSSSSTVSNISFVAAHSLKRAKFSLGGHS